MNNYYAVICADKVLEDVRKLWNDKGPGGFHYNICPFPIRKNGEITHWACCLQSPGLYEKVEKFCNENDFKLNTKDDFDLFVKEGTTSLAKTLNDAINMLKLR